MGLRDDIQVDLAEAFDDDLVTFFQAVGDDPCGTARVTGFDRTRSDLAISTDHHDSGAAWSTEYCLLRYGDGVFINRLFDAGTYIHTWQQQTIRVRNLSAQCNCAGSLVYGQIGEQQLAGTTIFLAVISHQGDFGCAFASALQFTFVHCAFQLQDFIR